MTITASPGPSDRPIARARWNVRVVMLAPNAISSGSAFRRSATARRDCASKSSVSALEGNDQCVLALWPSRYPVIAVNNAYTKYLFDNRYGTGQSGVDGVIRATNIMISGKVAAVAGYGWVGRGVAMRLHGLGARVIVTEVNPFRALEAVMDGYEVRKMSEAAKNADLFITATGDKNVITPEHMLSMKDGAIMANVGHFDVEIDVRELAKRAKKTRLIREHLREYTLQNGRRIYLLAEGRLVNLGAAEGHPSEVMDLSFANQALAAVHIAKDGRGLDNKVYEVSRETDERIARLKLGSMGIGIDALTAEQKEYMKQWRYGT